LWDITSRNLFRITWKNEPINSGGGFGGVNYLECPKSLTGVDARIIALVGKWFPTGSHKVGATFGCLVPRLITGQFDPTKDKAVWPSTGNYCRGGAYEVHIDGQTSTVTKYYAIAGQRVMRDSSGLHYLLTDHLGSVVAVLNSSGSVESDERYLPLGGLRDSTGISQTDFAFTGQRNLSDVGLMDYNARWYLPNVGSRIYAYD
jgi:hypothetical protein